MIKFYSDGNLGYIYEDVGWTWMLGEKLFCVGRIIC
jgi:hypothetical protein